jgi:hypothetical protein
MQGNAINVILDNPDSPAQHPAQVSLHLSFERQTRSDVTLHALQHMARRWHSSWAARDAQADQCSWVWIHTITCTECRIHVHFVSASSLHVTQRGRVATDADRVGLLTFP